MLGSRVRVPPISLSTPQYKSPVSFFPKETGDFVSRGSFRPFCPFWGPKLFDEVARFDYQNTQSIFRQGSILQVHLMLAGRAYFENAQHPVHRLLRICFSLVLVAAWSLNCHWTIAACGTDHTSSQTVVDERDESSPVDPTVLTPQAEGSELYPPTSLRFDAEDSAFIFWQPVTVASSRIVPKGLVLSFLCDSARHQCSGVQLA